VQPAQPPETVSAPVSDAISHHSLLDDALAASDLSASTGPEDAYLPWDGPDIDFTAFMLPQTDDVAVQLSPARLPLTAVQESTTPPSSTQLQEVGGIQYPRVLIPTPPPLYFLGSSSFAQRPKTGPAMQRTAKLVLQTLKSYPLMMLRHNTLPPITA
jgi:hypothetical protein